MKNWLVCFLIFSLSLFGEESLALMSSFQKKWTKEEIEQRIALFLQKDPSISRFFKLEKEEFIFYNGPETDKQRVEEFRLKFAQERQPLLVSEKKKSLLGMKIAIDPGHFGGVYARLEERYIDIPPSIGEKSSIQFDEGTLNFLTGYYLKILLEREGAIVLITRDQIGKGVYPEPFFEWLGKNPQFWHEKIPLNQIFRKHYNSLDLRERAKKINAFSPDLTIVIHYNSHEGIEERSSNHFLTAHNYSFVFIPGAFCQGELEEEENRKEFLRLLITEDLNLSLQLSRAILKQFPKRLGVPVVSEKDCVRYLSSVCLPIEQGIYSRNLALTRLIHGPVCYGETLIQNNIEECRNLDKKDFVIAGIRCSSRIKEVAEAYFEGIKEYIQSL